jgi:hypothetical protein
VKDGVVVQGRRHWVVAGSNLQYFSHFTPAQAALCTITTRSAILAATSFDPIVEACLARSLSTGHNCRQAPAVFQFLNETGFCLV